MANKFNFAWQLVRVQARKIKDVEQKIQKVVEYLKENPNIHNYDRVHNWMKMTALGYKGNTAAISLFNQAIKELEDHKSKYDDPFDNEADLHLAKTEDLKAVLTDLNSRKYDFQYSSVPKAHTEFVKQLETELKSR